MRYFLVFIKSSYHSGNNTSKMTNAIGCGVSLTDFQLMSFVYSVSLGFFAIQAFVFGDTPLSHAGE
jgi:hypothetical protein